MCVGIAPRLAAGHAHSYTRQLQQPHTGTRKFFAQQKDSLWAFLSATASICVTRLSCMLPWQLPLRRRGGTALGFLLAAAALAIATAALASEDGVCNASQQQACCPTDASLVLQVQHCAYRSNSITISSSHPLPL